jgi:hypothetical protein
LGTLKPELFGKPDRLASPIFEQLGSHHTSSIALHSLYHTPNQKATAGRQRPLHERSVGEFFASGGEILL